MQRKIGRWLALSGLVMFACVTVCPSDVVLRGTVGYFKPAEKEQKLAMLKEINANAVVTESTGRTIEITSETVRAIQAAGFKVWAFTIAYDNVFKNEKKDGLKYPYCFAGQYRKDWADIMAELARLGFDGMYVAPDEFNWSSAGIGYDFGMYWVEACRPFLQEQRAKWKYPYSEEFEKNYMARYKVPITQDEGDPNFRFFMMARYQAVADAIKLYVDTVKKVNPKIQTATQFSSYICNGKHYNMGTAWDMIGQSGIDSLGTDPYIQLHDDRGAMSHWYPTEAAIHLTSANQGKPCTIVPEGSRLRTHFPDLKPVEVYGPALSSVIHGARNIFYFSTDAQMGAYDLVKDLKRSHQNIKAGFDLLAATDSLWASVRIPRQIAVVYSRASDDFYQIFLRQRPANPLLAHRNREYRYPFLAQKEVIYTLLKEGYPFQLFYLDQLKEQDLKDFPVILLPFPFSVPRDKVGILERAVAAGSKLVVISEYGQVDELGTPYPKPVLLDLLGLASVPGPEKDLKLEFLADSPILAGKDFNQAGFSAYDSLATNKDVKFWTGTAEGEACGIFSRQQGKGEVIFLGGEFGIRTAISPIVFAFAGEFSTQQDLEVTDIPWERIGIYKKSTAYIETELPLSSTVKDYKLTIVVTGGPNAGTNDHFDIKINGQTVWTLPVKKEWINVNKVISIPTGDVYRVRIDLAGSAGAGVHKMFFEPILNAEAKKRPLREEDGRYRTIFLALLNRLLGEERLVRLDRKNYYDDIETWLLEAGKDQWIVWLANWDDQPRRIQLGLRLPAGNYRVQKHLATPEGYRAEAEVKLSDKELAQLKLELPGQQAAVWLLKK